MTPFSVASFIAAVTPVAAAEATLTLLPLQALVDGKLLLDPVPHEAAQQQGSLLVAYSSAANQVHNEQCTPDA